MSFHRGNLHFHNQRKFNELMNNAEKMEESLNQEINFVRNIAASQKKNWNHEIRSSKRHNSIRNIPPLGPGTKKFLSVSVLDGNKNSGRQMKLRSTLGKNTKTFISKSPRHKEGSNFDIFKDE